jgi:hypothetical protein
MEAPFPHGALNSKERDEDIPPPLIFNDIQRFSRETIMQKTATAAIHFMDKTKIVLRYPKQAGADTATIVANVKKALDADKLMVEVDDNLIVIPMRNVKYIQISPKPDALPSGVLRGAKLVG